MQIAYEKCRSFFAVVYSGLAETRSCGAVLMCGDVTTFASIVYDMKIKMQF